MRRSFRVSLLALVLAAPVHAADTRLKVRVSEAGGGKAFAGVTLVDASTTEVVDAAVLGGRLRASLRARPGTYHLVADVVRRETAAGALGPLFAVDDERKIRVVLPVAAIAPGARLAVTTPHTAGTGGPTATMGEVVVMTAQGAQTFEAPLLTVLFNRTQDICELRWVDSSRRVLEIRQVELDLQAQGRLDPLTPIRDARIPPTVRVEGSFVDDGSFISGELRLVDLATGQVLTRRQFRGRVRKFYRLYVEWGTEFSQDICDALGPTATTTTTPGTTTTLPGACQSDDQCGPCECCASNGLCGGSVGVSQCCNITGGPPTMPPNVCGPKQATTCPSQAVCPPPAQLGGNYYWCVGCPSGNIVEWYAPSGMTGMPGCARR